MSVVPLGISSGSSSTAAAAAAVSPTLFDSLH
jgi:hypothetical protein